MGDRTHVTLFIQKEHVEALKAIDDGSDDTFSASDKLVGFNYEEVNYGELDFLGKLRTAGIAYDSEWSHGGGYTSGGEYCRFTPEGEIQHLTIYDGEENPDLDKLIAFMEDHEALKKYIQDHKVSVTPLPWDNQVEYGKLYQARQLIAPD